MQKLHQLLHELIELAAPAGNKRGELHALADGILAEFAELAAGEGAAAKVPAGAKAAAPPRSPVPAPASFLPPLAGPGGPAQP